jgi:hypothetical protein
MTLSDTYFGDNAIKTYANNPTGWISSFLPTFWVIAGFILFIYMIAGGFMIISSSGDSKKADAGKEALTNAIIGFVIIFASYWIIQIIEVVTGVGILK